MYCPECGSNLKEKRNLKLATLVLVAILVVSVVVLFIQHNWVMVLESQVDELNIAVVKLEREKTMLEETVQSQGLEIEGLKNQVEGLNEELYRYKLNRPTMDELRRFLMVDELDSREWVKDVYDCEHFSRDLRVRAREAGWNFSIVSISYRVYGEEYGHACNGVILEDGRFVYVEPQTDQIYYSTEDIVKDLLEANGWFYVPSVKIIGEVVYW